MFVPSDRIREIKRTDAVDDESEWASRTVARHANHCSNPVENRSPAPSLPRTASFTLPTMRCS